MANTCPIPRGGTFHGASGTIDTSDYAAVHLEGQPFRLPALDSNGKVLKGLYVKGVIARNVSGDEIYPGHVMKWQSTYRGRRVDNEPGLYGEPAGIVDDQITQTSVRNGDLFLLITGGIARHKTHTTSATIAVGDALYASATAGTLVAFDEGSSSGEQYDMETHLELSKNQVGIATEACATTANDSSLRGIDVTIG